MWRNISNYSISPTLLEWNPHDLILLFTTRSGATDFVILAKTEESEQTIITHKQESEHKSNIPLFFSQDLPFSTFVKSFLLPNKSHTWSGEDVDDQGTTV